MKKQITIEDILSIHPRVDGLEDVYSIKTEYGIYYLEIYENSDFGLEYTLYDNYYDEIDGGVIDDYEAEEENAVAQVIFKLLEEMEVNGTSIEKLSHEEDDEENVDAFHEKVEKAWRDKVWRLKNKIIK